MALSGDSHPACAAVDFPGRYGKISAMSSKALIWWRGEAQKAMNNMLGVHKVVGGNGPGRRYATAQVNNAYAVLVSSQFQKYCRDLHSQAADHIAKQTPSNIQAVILARFTEGRKLDSGNPNPGNLGSDFGRFGLRLWEELGGRNSWNERRKKALERLMLWRNAIGHHDFSSGKCGNRTSVLLKEVRDWRRTCNHLATELDTVVGSHLELLTGVKPW